MGALDYLKKILKGPDAETLSAPAEKKNFGRPMRLDEPDRPPVFMFTLSTCGACRGAKSLLNKLEIPFGYVDVDLLSEAETNQALEEISKYNPAQSFPTILIGGRPEVVVGYLEDDIKSALEKLKS